MSHPAANSPPPSSGLRKTLGPVSLWGLGVGYVISGEYFGWNLGLPVGGTYGLLAAFVVITVMYVTFVFSYTEMACAIPRAGGVFVYGVRGLGLLGGYVGGVAQVVEFVFAPPAIAMALGAYGETWLPGVNPRVVATVAFLLFTGLNVWGVKQAALFELVITILAVGELLLFAGVAAPSFSLAHFQSDPLPNGWGGAVAALPFAIWFYLAIEGVANAAEESKQPQRDVAWGFGSALATLVILAALVLVLAVGVGGWQRIVYAPESLTTLPDGTLAVADGAATKDSPLPLALEQIFSRTHPLYHLLIGIGALGLIASLNGIILVAGRAIFEMGRVGFLPRLLGHTWQTTQTPAAALLLNLAVGVAAIWLFDTGLLITISALGAVTLYVVSMAALIRLRSREPDLPRPFRTPMYPVFPLVAMTIALGSLAFMGYDNLVAPDVLSRSATCWYLAILAGALAYYGLMIRGRLTPEDIAHFHRLNEDGPAAEAGTK